MADHEVDARTIELLGRVRAGDPGAKDTLVRRYEAPLRTYLRRRSRGLEGVTVDDLFQETQLEALKSLHTFTWRSPGSYLAWLYSVARAAVARAWKRAARAPRPLQFELDEDMPLTSRDLLGALGSRFTGPFDRVARNQRAELVLQALGELPDRQREALSVCYLEGIKGPEAAAALGLSHDAYRALLTRARRTLIRHLDAALAQGI